MVQFLDFEIATIDDSVQKLANEKSRIDTSVINSIYIEAQQYLPNVNKKFEDVIAFHNAMIQNRMDFISQRKSNKQKKLDKISAELNELLEAKKQLTIEILDEGLLDELNFLNRKIEELSEQKGEITQSIKLLTEQEQLKVKLSKQIQGIDAQADEEIVEENMKLFNNYFSEYCEKLYGEKYLLAYNTNWKEEKKFPVEIGSFGGNVGTGKKKAVISAFDLAYLKYAEIKKIPSPQFVIHDKLENTHINQLKSIFEICQTINGQYIIPILRERIDKIESEYIEKAKVLELSSKDKFFRV